MSSNNSNPGEFALVRLPADPGPLRELYTNKAIMVGPLTAITPSILGSKAQAELQARADSLARVEQAIERKQREHQLRAIKEETAELQRRLDALVERRTKAECESLANELNARNQKLVDTYSLPEDLPSDDLPEPTEDPTAAVSPDRGVMHDTEQTSYYPGPTKGREPDPPLEPFRTGAEPLPAHYYGDAPNDPYTPGHKSPQAFPLDPDVTGTEPIVDPKQLAHPQPSRQSPAAVEP